MAVNCGVSLGLCRMRVTRVDGNGNVISGTNAYVTDNQLSVTVNPNIEAGNNIAVRNGCGCKISSFKFPDTFNWWEFDFTDTALEPIMIGFMLGATQIKNGAVDVVGIQFPDTLSCDAAEPAVALEFWTKHGVQSGQDSTYPWIHWVFPLTIWQFGNNTFGDAAATPVLTGFSRANQNWGHGPYGDGPPDGGAIPNGGFWKTAVAPPASGCVAVSVSSVS